jgi:hypothetical protein
LTVLLSLSEKAGKGKVRVRVVEVGSDEQRNQAKQAGLREFAVASPEDSKTNQATIASAYLGIVFSYKTEKDTIPTGTVVGSVPIALAATGILRSATADFAGVTEVAVPERSAPGARTLVIASAQFLANPFVRALGIRDPNNPKAAWGLTEPDPILEAMSQAYA